MLKKRGIKAEELEPNNRNYKEAINNAGETVDEILDMEERIQRDINKKHEKKSGNGGDSGREEHVQGEVRRKKKFGQEIKEVQTLVNYLKEEQSKNPSQSNEDKLKEAEGKLKDLKKAFQYSPSSSQPFFSPLIIGGIVLIVVIGIVVSLLIRNKNKKEIQKNS